MTDTYGADVVWEDGTWQATVRDLPGAHTYAKSVAALRKRLREVIVLMADRPDSELDDEQAFTVGLDYRLTVGGVVGVTDGQPAGPPDVALAQARAARERAEQAEAEAEHATRIALLLAKDAGVSVRDAAALLGVSHQRVQQLLQAAQADSLSEPGARGR